MKKLRVKYSPTSIWKRSSVAKKSIYAGLAIGIIFVFLVMMVFLFPKICLDGFIKDQIIGAIAKAYPGYSLEIGDVNFSVLHNRLDCDSISLTKVNPTFSCRVGALSLVGIDWIKLLREKNFSSSSITEAALDAEGIVLNLNQSKNQIRCGSVHLSIPDSEIVAESLAFHPFITDEQFFAECKFRNTRYRFVIPKIRVNGLAYSGLLHGDSYRVRSINIQDAFLDIMVNMDKPFDTKSPSPLMPSEVLSSMKDTIRVGSLQFVNARLNYYERYAVGGKAALVAFDSIQVRAEPIVNHTGRRDTIVIHAQGNLMNTSTMDLVMLIPLGSPQFSYSYGGSLCEMELSNLNEFLETAEHRQIKSGILHGATFVVNVDSGRATGHVRAEYNDASFAVLNKNTGSENGTFDRISSFIGKTFAIRENNVPDKSGSLKIGVVKYTRNSSDTFIQFSWFALRSGVGNVVGF